MCAFVGVIIFIYTYIMKQCFATDTKPLLTLREVPLIPTWTLVWLISGGTFFLDTTSPHETGLAGTKLQRVNHLIDPFNPHTTPVVPQRRLH